MSIALHDGPRGQETIRFRELVRLAQHPQTGDGAARPQAVAAPPSQPAPSPLSTERGGVR